MSNEEKKPLLGAALEWDQEDEAVYEERMAQRLLTPEEREEIRAMMKRRIAKGQLICFGTGSK